MEDINKKGFNFTILFIVAFVIISLIVLIVIWWPKSATTKNKIVSYVTMNGQEESLKKYLTEIKELLVIDNSDKLYEKTNSDFLRQNALNKDNFKEFMNSKQYISKNPILKGNSVSKQENGVYVYRVEYLTYGGLKKYVNIIETKPYEYTLSFEQETLPITYNKINLNILDNVEYKATVSEIRDNSITYKLNITNNSDKTVKYNFDNIDNVYLVLTDNSVIKLAAAVMSSDEDILTPNGSLTKEFFFQLGTSYQENIKYLVIKSVEIGEETKEVIVNLK